VEVRENLAPPPRSATMGKTQRRGRAPRALRRWITMNIRDRNPRPDEFGENTGVLLTLLERPLTREAIKEQLRTFVRRFGFLGNYYYGAAHRGREFDQWLDERLEELLRKGWAVYERPSYALTEEGHRTASAALRGIRSVKERVEELASPQNVSKLTLIVHLVLAALKLPAGLLSGSVGLLNDAIDTLLDGASSLMVYWGLKRDREALVSRLLVFCMLATGGFALFEAVMRIIRQEPVGAEGFTFVAVIVSAAVCGLLWFVQRFVGLRRGSLALITQSVDSRNHVIVAGSVTAGLIAAALRFPWLDYLVGLAVALLILKSALELVVELIRARGEEVELEKHRFWFYERFRRSQMCWYMLYLVQDGQVETKQELIAAVERSFDFRDNILLQTVGLDQPPAGSAKLTASCYEQLLRGGLLQDSGRLVITETGRRHLSSNRFFVRGEARNELRRSARLGLRVGLALVGRWLAFFALFWLGSRYLVPLLPALPLWDSLDRGVAKAAGLELSLFGLIHLGVGFALATWATVRLSLVRAWHFTWRERTGKSPAALITEGFFARVRHPMAGATFLYGLGLLCSFRSGWALIPLAAAAILSVVSTRAEERRELMPRFEEQYSRYAQKVRSRLFTPLQLAFIAAVGALFAAGLVL
jgi:protein-S-isoprenylcysteine O-methyltransferase Ste14